MSLFKLFRKSNKSDLAKQMSDDPMFQGIFENAMEKTAEDLNRGEHYLQKGLHAAQLKDFDGAISHFNKSLEFADYISMVYLNRGAMYQMQERYLDARDDYMKALEIESEDPSDDHAETVNAATQNLRVVSFYCQLFDDKGYIVKQQIKDDGLDYAAGRYAESIWQMLENDRELIRQFVYEELEELDELGGKALEFALASGITRQEYVGAVDVDNRHSSLDKANHFLKMIKCCVGRSPEKMLEFRIAVIGKIMDNHGIGKF